jgi:hypothetical protein
MNRCYSWYTAATNVNRVIVGYITASSAEAIVGSHCCNHDLGSHYATMAFDSTGTFHIIVNCYSLGYCAKVNARGDA